MSKHSKVDFVRNEVEATLGYKANTKRYTTALLMAKGANMQSKIYNIAKVYRSLAWNKDSERYEYNNKKYNKKRKGGKTYA